MAKKKYLKRSILFVCKWAIIGMHKILGPPHVLNYNLAINAAVLRAFGATVGKDPKIFPPLTIYNGYCGYHNLTIGDNCVIQGNVYIDVTGPITLEDGVSLGPGTIVMTHNRYNSNAFLEQHLPHTTGTKAVLIKKGAGIKAGSTIIMGITIGENAVVAAGAVVNRDVDDNCFVAGVPARLKRVIGKDDWPEEAEQ